MGQGKISKKQAEILEYITDVFVSDRTGYKKPNKEFFDYCFSNMDGATKSQTVMIGDSLTADVKGGNDYGIITVWYNGDNLENNTEIIPDETINSLLELKNIL